MEAGRTVANGFVSADRTTVIGSTHRAYAIAEKMAMGDGRYDNERLRAAIAANSPRPFVFDMDAVAKDSGAMINAVMLGAIAGCGRLPLPPDACETAIRADGKAVDANLRGFGAGLAAAQRCVSHTPRRHGTPRRPPCRAARPARSKRRHSRGRPRHRPARACAAHRLSGRGLCASLSRSPARRSARPTRARMPTVAWSPRPRAISRCACPTRT